MIKDEVKNNMVKREEFLSEYAKKSLDAERLIPEDNDFRPAFFRDTDRIIHTDSYTRYADKTQVFSNVDNDNISRRFIHVQLVSKIARTIGRALNLNEDLIEAIALGHDLGHVPFGHVGEKILNEISLQFNQGYFRHNVQSVRNLMILENNGQGLNITIEVLDGILCHNGELVGDKYYPQNKTKEEFLNDYKQGYLEKNYDNKLRPMTLEGCVVRISDVIAYIGRDIEDAIKLDIIKKEDIPQNIIDVLGSTNKAIVNNIVIDIINNSIGKDYICMSQPVFLALNALKEFNYNNIYNKANSLKTIENYKTMFHEVYENCLNQIKNKDYKSLIYINFINNMSLEYINNNSCERIVIDYIAGMTDDYFIKEYENINKKNIK